MKHFEHHHKSGCSGVKGIVFGLLVVATGVVLLLKNMEMIDPFYSQVLISWPMLIVALGFINLFGKEFPFGIILVIIGGLFLGTKFFGWSLGIEQIIWPALLILFGLIVVVGSRFVIKGVFKKGFSTNDESVVEEVNVFGGSQKILTTQEFKGGKFVCVFGGSEVNMMQTSLAKEGAVVELVAIFGGLSLIVPSDWNIKVETTNIFGGIGDKRVVTATSTEKKVVLKGICLFGGCEIKSVPV